MGLLGATSLVGECLLPMLARSGWQVTAYSRRGIARPAGDAEWRRLGNPGDRQDGDIPCWICAAPVWVLPEHFGLLEAHRARRLVVLSSTSRFTKDASPDAEERAVARRLADAEECVRSWAEEQGVEWLILRPTLIYGGGRDRNI